MRMWLVDPALLCRQHLLGEHLELHMLYGTIRSGKSLAGYVANGLIETHNITARHAQLAAEMTARGYRHASPLDYDDDLRLGVVDIVESMRELIRRCDDCRDRIQYTCPVCGMTSHHPNDVADGYCGKCCDWTRESA